MNKKQKNLLIRIIVASVFFVPLYLISEGVIRADVPEWALLVLFLVPYLTVGHDIIRKALLGIKNRQIFDEHFLMTIATIGAIALGEYGEGVFFNRDFFERNLTQVAYFTEEDTVIYKIY